MATLSLRRELKAALRVLTSFFVFAVCAGAMAEEWISIGPFGTQLINNDVVAGQVNALAVDPRDAAVLYVGASEGGVWKTSDGGGSWAPLADTQLVRKLSSGKSRGTLSIGSIAVNPANPQVLYVGTGEPNLACCFAGPGLGVFRSMDGGGSWLPLGTNLTQTACQNAAMSQAIVNRILVIPGRPTMVFAATNMGLFSYPESGSDCWTQLTIGLPFANAIDLVVDPFQGALYVAFWGLGIFKLTDPASGQWQMLSGGLPTSGFSRIALAFGGRSGLGFSPPLPLLYAGFNAGGQYRLFTTRDGGTAWTELPSPPSDGQLDFNNTIAVGLYSSDEVYVGQIALWRTLDGGRKGGKNNYKPTPPVEGNSWTNLSCCLADANPFRKKFWIFMAIFMTSSWHPMAAFCPRRRR